MSTRPRRYSYPTDTTEEEWAFAAPYLTLLPADAGQRRHELRAVYDALRWIVPGTRSTTRRGARA